MIQLENERRKPFGYISSSSDSSRKMECRAPFGNMSSSNDSAKNGMHGNLLVT